MSSNSNVQQLTVALLLFSAFSFWERLEEVVAEKVIAVACLVDVMQADIQYRHHLVFVIASKPYVASSRLPEV